MDGLELVDAELAGDPADLEVEEVGGGEVGHDAADVEPDEEAADLDALEVADGAVPEDAGHPGSVVDQVLEVDVAWAVEVHDEAAVAGDGKGLDGVREDARRQAVLRKEIVNGGAVRRRRRGLDLRDDDGGKEEEDDVEEEG